jgi:hypothetical protein
MKKIVIIAIILLSIASRVFAPLDLISKTITEYKIFMLSKSVEQLELFLDSLGNAETHSPEIYPWRGFKTPYNVVNEKGAAGRWQLMPIARQDIGYNGSLKHFLNSEAVQRDCVIKLFRKNKFYMEQYIPNFRDYIGKTIHGVEITYSGMIAAAHLAGIGGLIQFLKYGYDATDGHESVKSYMKKFGGYKIGLII